MPNNLSTYEKIYNNIRFSTNITLILAATGTLLIYLIERDINLLYCAIGSFSLFGATFCCCQGYTSNEENIALENNGYDRGPVTTIEITVDPEATIPHAVAINYYNDADGSNVPSAPPLAEVEKTLP